MDLKGSLVDTRLRIYPSKFFIDFLKTLPNGKNIPNNILKLIDRDCNAITEDVLQPKEAQLNDKDLENLREIKRLVKTDDNADDKDPLPDDKAFEKEKIGDTPEKQMNRENTKDSNPEKLKRENTKESNSEKESLEKDKGDCNVESKENDSRPFLTTSDVDWIYTYLQKKMKNGDDVPHLHTLLEGASIEMPENKILKRNPELEARCVKLRAQQEAREYRKMTKTVDNVRMKFPEDSISYQLKQMNRQLIAIGQFIISIFAGFLFGFRGIEWMVGNLDFGFRMLLGVMCALIIALAEIYFLAKKLNEELSIPETVQLGGPVKFADEAKYMHTVSNKVPDKQHQD